MLFNRRLKTIARSLKTRHFQTRIQPAVFKLKRIVVPVDQFVTFLQILDEKRWIFHKPCACCRNSVKVFRNLLWKTDSIQKKVNFSLFSSAKGYSFHLFNLLYFSLKLLIQHSSSKFRAWVLRFLILEIRKASFINATWPIMALSSLILGFSERVFALRWSWIFNECHSILPYGLFWCFGDAENYLTCWKEAPNWKLESRHSVH